MRLAIVLIGLSLAGCSSQGGLSVRDGECKIVHTPEFVVRGQTSYDQNWIDDTTEALVRGCSQPRPEARPEALEIKKVSPPKKKKTLLQRILPKPRPVIEPPPVEKTPWPIPTPPDLSIAEPPAPEPPPPPPMPPPRPPKPWWQKALGWK